MKNKIYFAAAFILCGVCGLFAQEKLTLSVNSLVYNSTYGAYSFEVINIPVDEIRDITFSLLGDQMIITKTDNSTLTVQNQRPLMIEVGAWSYAKISFAMMNTTKNHTPKNSEVKIYPNPAKDIINIKGLDATDPVITLFGNDGRAVTLPASLQKGGLQLNISALPQGMYYINNNNQYCKFIKK